MSEDARVNTRRGAPSRCAPHPILPLTDPEYMPTSSPLLPRRCWGTGSSGRLGYGDTKDVPEPKLDAVVPVGEPVAQLALGGAFTCALTVTGKVKCVLRRERSCQGAASASRMGRERRRRKRA